VNGVDAVIVRVVWVLRPGGVFVFDTSDRAPIGRFVTAFALQGFP
jgi:hypothetical protein